MDIQSEQSIQNALNNIETSTLFDIVIVGAGFLHDKYITPEKVLRDINNDNLGRVFSVNAFGQHYFQSIFCHASSVIEKAFLPVCLRVLAVFVITALAVGVLPVLPKLL